MKKLPALKRIVVTFCEEGEISDEDGKVEVIVSKEEAKEVYKMIANKVSSTIDNFDEYNTLF